MSGIAMLEADMLRRQLDTAVRQLDNVGLENIQLRTALRGALEYLRNFQRTSSASFDELEEWEKLVEDKS